MRRRVKRALAELKERGEPTPSTGRVAAVVNEGRPQGEEYPHGHVLRALRRLEEDGSVIEVFEDGPRRWRLLG